MNAEEYLDSIEWQEDNYLTNAYEWINPKDIQDVMEAYAKQKVLEALEDVKRTLDNANEISQKNGDIYTAIGCIHLIKTEVEPKYK